MAPGQSNDEIGTALALAVIASSQSPLLVLDGEFQIVAASESFLRAFDLEAVNVRGRPLFGLGDGEWDMSRLRSLLSAGRSGSAEISSYDLGNGRPCMSPTLADGERETARAPRRCGRANSANGGRHDRSPRRRDTHVICGGTKIAFFGDPAPRSQQPADHRQRFARKVESEESSIRRARWI
jgi:hypothetical protein